MKNLCKHFSGGGNFKKPTTQVVRGTFFSLLLTTCAAFTACTEKEDFNVDNNKLQVTFGVNSHGSRAINHETSLPDGIQVGARLDGYAGYENLVYTASTGKTPQEWTGDKNVVLSDVNGTLYAFYPYDEDIDMTAIPVDMTAADQTDWLYGTPVTGVNDLNPEADVSMNHALANINLSIVRDTYVGTGEITSISVQSDGIASKGTFNAAQATPGYTAFTNAGETFERSVTTTLGATATDIMVIPTGTEAAITFFVTVDGVVYTVKSAPLTLEMGNSYQYTLKLNSTFMSVDGVSVTPWNNVSKEDDLELEEYRPSVINVYAVSSTNQLIDFNTADETCKGVAIHATGKNFNKKFMIAKADANDGTNSTFYWSKELSSKDVAGITDISSGDSYIGESKTYGSDFASWTTGPVVDFGGKNNTTAIITAYAEHSVQMDSRDMCKVLETFNSGSDNQGYNDWYIPAEGQLALMYLAINDINAALAKIGGATLVFGNYWSSSECNSINGWFVGFGSAKVSIYTKSIDNYVRFVRDIE